MIQNDKIINTSNRIINKVPSRILNKNNKINKTKILKYVGYWTVNVVMNNPRYLFIYGDNEIHQGRGGQAIIRDCPNTFGIPTKKYPNNNPASFWTDREYHRNCAILNNYFGLLCKTIKEKRYDAIIIPENGLGTGLSQLPELAPKTHRYLNKWLQKIINKYNPEMINQFEFLKDV